MRCGERAAESSGLRVLKFKQIISLVTLGKSFNFSEPSLFIKWITGLFKAEGGTHKLCTSKKNVKTLLIGGGRAPVRGRDRRRGKSRLPDEHRGSIPEPWDHDLGWKQMLNPLSHPGCPLKELSILRPGVTLALAPRLLLAEPCEVLFQVLLFSKRLAHCCQLPFCRNTWCHKNSPKELTAESSLDSCPSCVTLGSPLL